jgi:hypothetical protein
MLPACLQHHVLLLLLLQCAAPAIAAELSEACFFINLLADDAWQPWALEFFYQSSDDAKRAAFLRGAELLSLFCELKQDEGFKRERCGQCLMVLILL